MSRQVRVRPLTADEFEEVAAIFFATGWLGYPLAPLFSSRKFLAAAFLGRYFRAEGCSVTGALTAKGELVGYVLGDIGCSKLAILSADLWCLLLLFWQDGVPWQWRNWKYVGRWLRAWFLGELSVPRQQELRRKYPAHLHINVQAGFRTSGIGGRLLEHQLNSFRRQRLTGVHLATYGFAGEEEGSSVRFFARHGFKIWSQRPTSVFPPLHQRLQQRTIMVKTLS